jgi:aspartyl-tRNA(Asn)/glutamyl-tRNA(Gln) amidotransferase subunit A
VRTIGEAAKALRERRTTCVELARGSLERIEALQPQTNAFLTVTADAALARAEILDRELAGGRDRGPLHGIPYACKDCIDTAGVRTTVGSRFFENRIPASDAAAVERLAAAGAVMLGKTNLNEFAAGTSGKNMHFGDVRNPWSREHSPGGSSSGSAVAVASGMVLAALGTDTGGSIRVPAACTGIVGIRPTFGRVPIQGVFPRAESFDVVGPLARCARDCALLLDALVPNEDFAPGIDTGIAGLRVGLVEDICKARASFRALGADVREIAMPGALDYNVLVDIMLFEFHRVLGEQFRACPEPDKVFGPVVCANLRLGQRISESAYRDALEARERQSARIHAMLSEIDALVTPVLPGPTPRLDAPTEEFDRQRKYMIPFSGAGVPALSLPCGVREGMPVGMQVVAGRGQEKLLLRIAQAYESTHGGGVAS